MKKKTVVIIGAGNVGSHIASASIHRNLPADIILVDICDEFEKAQVLDLKDMLSFSENTTISVGDLTDQAVHQADVFIITAGVSQREDEDRISLLSRNVEVLEDIHENLGAIKKTAIVILVTNPVDILTQKASEIFSLPAGQVFGTGTSLDSSRLKWHLSEWKGTDGKSVFQQDPAKIQAFVLGEHGDSSFVCWSQIQKSDKLSAEEKNSIEQSVRDEAYEIISGKDATYFGIGATTAAILGAIVCNTKKVFFVSVPLDGQYGQTGLSIGVPAKISKKGIAKVIEKKLSPDEEEKFDHSASLLKKFL